MSTDHILPVSKTLFNSINKTCRSCGYWSLSSGATPVCGHPKNIAPEIDLISGSRIYLQTIVQMRSTTCGLNGALHVKPAVLQAAFDVINVPNQRNRKLGEDDI